ncbi:MAG: hypothetical protein ACRC62_30150 [Microcoleus sp.]
MDFRVLMESGFAAWLYPVALFAIRATDTQPFPMKNLTLNSQLSTLNCLLPFLV